MLKNKLFSPIIVIDLEYYPALKYLQHLCLLFFSQRCNMNLGVKQSFENYAVPK